MLKYALIFFVLALACGLLGFGGFVGGTLLWVAKVLFILFIIMFLVSVITGRPMQDPLP